MNKAEYSDDTKLQGLRRRLLVEKNQIYASRKESGRLGGLHRNPKKGFGSNRALAVVAGTLGGSRGSRKGVSPTCSTCHIVGHTSRGCKG